jgi:hypothetical protein
MRAEFGKRVPFGGRFPSTHSVEASAVGSASSFGKKSFSTAEGGNVRDCVMTWTGYKEGSGLMMDTKPT